MALNSPKLVKTITEAERVEAAVDKMTSLLSQLGDVLERTNDKLGTAVNTLAAASKTS